MAEVKKTKDPVRAAKSLIGKCRLSIMARGYLASWQKFRKWFQSRARLGALPPGISLVDCLYMREDQGMGASIPLAVFQAVGWFENAGGFCQEHRLLAHPMVAGVVRELTIKLEEKAPPVKRAPRWLSVFFSAIEDIAVDPRRGLGQRVAAWRKLVKAWASLRFRDVANLRIGNIRYFDGQLSGVMRKTKTTSAGKRVRELPIHTCSGAYIKHKDWLGAVG